MEKPKNGKLPFLKKDPLLYVLFFIPKGNWKWQDEDGIKATSSLRPPVPVVLTRRVSPNPAASQA
eukprot:2257341-Amphidinium_carterae.1